MVILNKASVDVLIFSHDRSEAIWNNFHYTSNES